ncbi:hypothetical protein QFC22_004794 [Naganishia vaughanmartiniae]|uniref:Uncharacterized protein n=1 Tax=Naganishia vaughanmartiniae TaxID=1424756 RepID=A0ACC2WXX5_9TREE|nr:hypothetical protein QFC22_004794 [Naganishia vaughanmartiniae]
MSEPPPVVDSDPTYTHFTHRDEFTQLLDEYLGRLILDAEYTGLDDPERERKLVEQMGGILDHYLPLPPLLDPYLHSIIPPLMAKLSTHFQALWQAAEDEKQRHTPAIAGQPAVKVHSNVERLAGVGRLLNWVVKVRGRKIAVTHFPSEITNLPVLIYLLSPPSPSFSVQANDEEDEFPCHPALSRASSWEIRSICFLWLSLLLTVPFDLSAFDTAQKTSPPPTTAQSNSNRDHSDPNADPDLDRDRQTTSTRVLTIGKRNLNVPSKEGEYSSLLLARLFSRKDGVERLDGFFEWVAEQLGRSSSEAAAAAAAAPARVGKRAEGNQAVFLTNILALLAQLPSLLPNARTHLPKLLEFYTRVIAPHVEGTTAAPSSSSSGTHPAPVAVLSNGLLRKMAVKARGRWWLAMLETTMGDAGRARRSARGRRVKVVQQDGQANILQSLDCQLGRVDIQEEEEDEFDPPEGLEEEIERLMDCLSDKVGSSGPTDLAIARSQPAMNRCLTLVSLQDTIVRYSAAKYISRIADLLPRSLASQIVESTISLFSGTPEDPLVETERGKVVDPGGGSNGDAKWHGLCLALAEMGRRGLIGDEIVGDLLGWAVKALNFDIRRGAHSIGSNVRDAAAYLIWSLARALPPSTIRPYTDRIAQVLVSVACFDREVGIRRAASAAFQEHVGRMGMFPHGIDVLRKTDFYAVSVRRTAFLVSAPQVAVHEEYRSAMLEHLHYVTLRHWDPAMRLIGAQSLKLICELEESLPAQALQLEMDQLGSVELANIHGALAALDELACVYRARDDQRRLAEIFGSLCNVRASVFALPGSDLLLEAACRVISRTACKDAVHVKANWDVCSRILDLGMKCRKEDVQIAASRAFGAADYTRTPELLQPVLKCLLGNVSISTKAIQQDVETRRASYQSILEILRTTEHCAIQVSTEEFFKCYTSFLDGLDDYSTDQRGDVGSWVRIACAQALPSLTRMAKAMDTTLGDEGCLHAVYGLIKLSVEKLETVRVVAGPALCEIVEEHGSAIGLEDVHRHLISGRDRETICDWKDVQTLYPTVGVLLPCSNVQRPVFEGLILSLGGKNLLTQNAAATAITRSIHSFSNSHPKLVEELTHGLLTFGTENINKQRVFVPVLLGGFELAQADIWNELSATASCSQE